MPAAKIEQLEKKIGSHWIRNASVGAWPGTDRNLSRTLGGGGAVGTKSLSQKEKKKKRHTGVSDKERHKLKKKTHTLKRICNGHQKTRGSRA